MSGIRIRTVFAWRAGITNLWLRVSPQTQDDSAACLQAETAAELAASLPALLDRAFRGEL
jgi:hypothetical protein